MTEGTANGQAVVPPDGDELPVLAEVRAIEPSRPVTSPAVQAAAVAAGSFVAGVATVALVRHRQATRVTRRARRKSRGGELIEVVSSRSFLVDVHLLGNRR